MIASWPFQQTRSYVLPRLTIVLAVEMESNSLVCSPSLSWGPWLLTKSIARFKVSHDLGKRQHG